MKHLPPRRSAGTPPHVFHSVYARIRWSTSDSSYFWSWLTERSAKGVGYVDPGTFYRECQLETYRIALNWL